MSTSGSEEDADEGDDEDDEDDNDDADVEHDCWHPDAVRMLVAMLTAMVSMVMLTSMMRRR